MDSHDSYAAQPGEIRWQIVSFDFATPRAVAIDFRSPNVGHRDHRETCPSGLQ